MQYQVCIKNVNVGLKSVSASLDIIRDYEANLIVSTNPPTSEICFQARTLVVVEVIEFLLFLSKKYMIKKFQVDNRTAVP